MPPKDEFWKPLQLGEQHFDWGYHGGRKHSQHQRHNQMGYHLLDEPELAARHYEWVREIIETYKNDERICFWDLYNEPGNAHREEVNLPHLVKFYEICLLYTSLPRQSRRRRGNPCRSARGESSQTSAA